MYIMIHIKLLLIRSNKLACINELHRYLFKKASVPMTYGLISPRLSALSFVNWFYNNLPE